MNEANPCAENLSALAADIRQGYRHSGRHRLKASEAAIAQAKTLRQYHQRNNNYYADVSDMAVAVLAGEIRKDNLTKRRGILMIDYDILEQFVTFYKTGTLRGTAEKMHISQPTLTRNMQKLESEFGVSLFHRTKNSISLNETGLLAAEDAEMLLKQTENMLQRAREFDRKNRTIMLGACTPVYVPELIHRITALCPAAAISSEIKGIPQLLEDVKNGSCHFVLLPFCPEENDLFCKKWGEEHLSFLLPKRHRFARRKSLSVSEMNGENMLLLQDIGFWHDLVVEKMPDSHFLVQTERYSFQELIENSTMPVFTTDYSYGTPSYSFFAADRVSIPITDPDFNVSYYLVCRKENAGRFTGLF